jgi:hypothetical protein
MATKRFKILFVGRRPRLPRRLSNIFKGAGYSLSAPRRAPALARDRAAIGTWIDAGVTPAELEQALSFETAGNAEQFRLFMIDVTYDAAASRSRSRPKRSGEGPAAAMSLQAFRERVGRTQGEIARRIAMTQPQLSRVERRRDHLTSTLRKYVRALGGRIEVAAVVKGKRIVLQGV